MGLGNFYRSTRKYISRAWGEKGTHEDPYAEKPFEKTHKRSLVSKIFGGIGKFLGRIPYYAAVATVIPAAISFYRTTPEKSSLFFRKNTQNAYVMKQYFDGTRASALGPNQTGLFNKLIERDAKHKGLSNIVSAETQEGDCRFDMRTRDNFEGTMEVQYLYRVRDAEGANNWFWEFGLDRGKIDEVVRGALTSVLGEVRGEDVAVGIIRDKDGNELKDKDGNQVNYMDLAEIKANAALERERIGVRVSKFSRVGVNFNEESEKVLRTVDTAKLVAQAAVIESQGKAAALDIEAAAEARQSQTQFRTHSEQAVGAYELGLRIYGGDINKAGQFAENFSTRLTNRLMVNEGARPLIVTGGFQQPQVVVQTIGQANPPTEPAPKRVNGGEVIDSA